MIRPILFDPIALAAETFASWLYPPVCQVCRAEPAPPNQGFICADCARRVHLITPPFCQRCGLPFPGDITQPFECSNCRDLHFAFSSARAAASADGLLRDLIHRYKYNGHTWFEPFFDGLQTAQANALLQRSDWDLLVPVPLHPVRQRERGYNQAERLARRLSAAWAIPIAPRLVIRVEATPTQTQLTREARLRNVRRAFRPARKARLRGERCLVIDDVLTTGATIHGVAAALRELGASEVGAWTLARGV